MLMNATHHFITKHQNKETIMKINALVITFLMTLAGCSASVHGDVQGLNKPENTKNGRYVVSNTVTSQTEVAVSK